LNFTALLRNPVDDFQRSHDSQEPGKRHIPEATLPPSSVTPVAADFAPSTVLFQGQNDAASGTSRSPGSHDENLKKIVRFGSSSFLMDCRLRDKSAFCEVINLLGPGECQIHVSQLQNAPFCPISASPMGGICQQARILILEIFNIFLWLKFSPFLTSNKIERFETGSCVKKLTNPRCQENASGCAPGDEGSDPVRIAWFRILLHILCILSRIAIKT